MFVCKTVPIAANQRIGDSIFKIRVDVAEIANVILPGQFVMLRVHQRMQPLLARPLALYDTIDGETGTPRFIDLVYIRSGEGTSAISQLQPGDRVDVWGPLGNSFPTDRPEVDLTQLLILAGGIGQTPFLAVIKEVLGQRRYGRREHPGMLQPRSVMFCWGARSASMLAGVDDFRLSGVAVNTATDDGSTGFHGNVAQLAEAVLDKTRTPTAIFACGPERMLEAVSSLAQAHGVPAWVSLETKMACGYGVCFSCVCAVADATNPSGWDYRRVCLEGPVFDASRIKWEK